MTSPFNNSEHPPQAFELLRDHIAQQIDTGEFPDRFSRNEPDTILTRSGALNPVIMELSQNVPEPVQMRTPAMIHYPRARDVIVVNSGVDINEQKIGFDCRAIVVQNVGTNGFLFCPELNMYLTTAATPLATYNLPSSVEKLSFKWHSGAFNFTTPAVVAGQWALVWLYDEWVPPAETASGGGGTSTTGVITSATAAQTNVAQNVASVTILALNAARKDASIFNDSAANMFVSFAAIASATAFKVKIAAGGYWSMQPGVVYTGQITAIWDAAGAGAARVTELT